MRRRWLLAGGLALVALTYLIYSGWQAAAVYYYTPEEALELRAELQGRPFRLTGVVDPRGPVWDPARSEVRFEVSDGVSMVSVLHRGPVPGGLAAGQQVVVEGSWDPHGVVVARSIIRKCPSKYEESRETTAAGGGRVWLIGLLAGTAAIGVVAGAVHWATRPRGWRGERD